MALPELRIIYRSNSHAPLWVVAEKSGVWERNGLAISTSVEARVEWRIRGNFCHPSSRHSCRESGSPRDPGARHVHDTRRDSDHNYELRKNHEAKIRHLIRGFVDAIHFFVTRKHETLEMLKEHTTPILLPRSDEEVEALYEE
jgi:hypothetical protein